MALPENIKLLRNHFNITQSELAAIAGVTYSTVSTWELGRSQPRMSVIQKIADHYGISKSNLIEDGGMIEILGRPYNLNDLERFENMPPERLTRVQRESLEYGIEHSKTIFEGLDKLTSLIVEALDELPEDEKQRVLDFVEFQRQQRQKRGSGEGGDDK